MNACSFPVDMLSAALQQQQQISPTQNGQATSAFQYRSSSVIVHPPNTVCDDRNRNGNAQILQQQPVEGSLLKKKRGNAGGKRPNPRDNDNQLMGGSGGKMPKIDMAQGGGGGSRGKQQRALSPEVLGVNRFISPFSPEAKIPLPHELNELSAHGTTVWKRNERERQRVRCVNEGYSQLRNQLPLTEHDRRLSKVDTLRLAIAYIGHLEQLLALGQAHQFDCQCFNNYTSSGEEGGSGENTPPPPN